MYLISLTNWDDFLTIGAFAALLAAIVSRGKDLATIYNWIKIGLESIEERSIRHQLFLLEEAKWRDYEILGLARWQTAKLPNGTFGAIRVSSELVRIVGLKESEILDEGWKSAVHPKYSGVIAAWDNAIKNETNFQYKWAFQHRDGKVVYVYGEFHRITNRRGRFLGGIGSLTEITRKDVEDSTDA